MVLLVHDPCDVFMEYAKLCKYAGKQLFADLNFGTFALLWLILRLIIFPFWVIHSFLFVSVHFIDLIVF